MDHKSQKVHDYDSYDDNFSYCERMTKNKSNEKKNCKIVIQFRKVPLTKC